MKTLIIIAIMAVLFVSGCGYNSAGYDWLGYDRTGYNKQGYDFAGFNRQGYDKYGRTRTEVNAIRSANLANFFRSWNQSYRQSREDALRESQIEYNTRPYKVGGVLYIPRRR